MAGPYIVPQSGVAITISSIAAGFTQNPNNNPYQYYLNSGGNSQQSDKYTFTFADGGSFYLTDFSQTGSAFGNAFASSSSSNVVGIPNAPDSGYGSTINVIGGSNFVATYDIHDATNKTLLFDNFQPQRPFTAGDFFEPISQFEYSSGTLTVRTPTTAAAPFPSSASINPDGRLNPSTPVNEKGYRGGAGGTLGPNAQSQYISGGIIGNTSTPWVFSLITPATNIVPCFYQGTLITLASGQTKSVEDLAIGDIIHTHKDPLPLKWLARRKVTKSVRQQFPHQLPVVIESGALGVNMPSTDLMVSQGHTILVDGHLICAALLENEINCYRARCEDLPDEYYYFHLEFQDEEVLVLSNGAPTASYVNTQTRMMFDNYQEYVDLYGDLNAEIKPLEYKHRRTVCFLDPYKAVVRRSFQEPAVWV